MVLLCMISTDKKILIGYKRIELDDDKKIGGIAVIREWYEMNYYRMIGFPESYHNLWELPNYENEEKPKVNIKVTEDKLIISLSEYGIKEEFNKDKNKSFIESFKENPPIKFRHELEEDNYPFFKVYFKHASKNTK